MSKSISNSGSTTNAEELRQIRENTIAKWSALGFLDGLKGHVDPNIAKLYECCKSTEINEVKKDWEVYMVECSDGTLYTGISNDVPKRVLTHNSGKGAKYTKTRLPVVLKWQKQCENRSEASKEEYKVKKLTKKQKLKLIEEYER